MEINERANAILDFFRTHAWIKGQLWQTEDSRVTAACLAGAEMSVAGDWNLVTPEIGKIAAAEYPERLEYWENLDLTSAGVIFNNHKDTTFGDLQRCLEKVASLELVS